MRYSPILLHNSMILRLKNCAAITAILCQDISINPQIFQAHFQEILFPTVCSRQIYFLFFVFVRKSFSFSCNRVMGEGKTWHLFSHSFSLSIKETRDWCWIAFGSKIVYHLQNWAQSWTHRLVTLLLKVITLHWNIWFLAVLHNSFIFSSQ